MTERQCKTAENLARDLMTRTEHLYNMRSQHIRPRAGGTLLETSPNETGHLWEHSRLVAGLARRLAGAEGTDGNEAYLAGLLHDAGKFAGGRYHDDDVPEERASAAAATKILIKSGFGPRLVGRVAAALASLYREGKKRNTLSDIVHDADFLAKSGRLGVAHFFIKSTLRGRDLARMATESLSRELTYAAVLPRNMRTTAGRRLAAFRAAETRRYFRGLLREIEEAQGIRFTMRRLMISRAQPPAGSRASGAGGPGMSVRPATAHGPVPARKNAAARSGVFTANIGGRKRKGGTSFKTTDAGNAHPGRSARPVPVTLVHPRACDRCGGKWRLAVSTEQGIKCERLEALLVCAACGLERGASFCLPEIPQSRRRPFRP